MKIGLVCPYSMFKGGGVKEHVNMLYEELSRRGHEVKVITPLPRDYDGEVPPHIITIGGSANIKAFLKTQSQLSAAVDSEAIEQMLSREKFKLLHFHEPWVPFLSRQILSRSRSVNIATSHARLPDRFASKTVVNVFIPYARGLLKYIQAYTAVSDPATVLIRNLIDDPIEIIPNGIEVARYEPAGPPEKHKTAKTIFYVGRLEKRKGIKYLLQAYALLAERNPDVKLVLAGTGPEEKSLRGYVKEMDIPRVTFLGFISEVEKIKQLHQADVFSSAARYGESFGIVLIESMAAGTPIVAGNNPGYETVLQGTGRISLVNSVDSDDYARRLELLLYDEDLRKLWQSWAAKEVKQYDRKQVVDQYEKLYNDTLAKYG